MSNSYVSVAFLMSMLMAPMAWGCDLGTVTTADGKFDLHVKANTETCEFRTGEALSTQVLVFESGTTRASGVVEIAGVEVKRDDGLAPNTPTSVRKIKDGVFFADNFDFAAAGNWEISLILRRGVAEETVKVTVPVKLNNMQAQKVVANVAKVPKFALTDLAGKSVTHKDLIGKVWVSNFFFSSCAEICPLMSQKLAVLQKQFKDAKDFRIVSVSTDPKNDSAAVLKNYAGRYKAETGRWTFLRGPKPEVVALSDGGLSLDVTLDSPMHSTRFALVDRDGTVRGRYDSTKIEELEQLKIAIKDLLDQKGDRS